MKKEDLMIKTEKITIVNKNKVEFNYDPIGLEPIKPGETITLSNYFYTISNKLPLMYPYSSGDNKGWITMTDVLENFEIVK